MPIYSNIMGLKPDEFKKAFPFHLVFNRDLKIIQSGLVIGRLCEFTQSNNDLLEHFEILQPYNLNDFDTFCENTTRLIVIRHRKTRVTLRGQFILRDSTDKMLFLGSAWLTSAQELETHHLTLDDFALHDPIVDLIQLSQAKDMAKLDIDKLVEKLKAKSFDLQSANETLRSQNEDLKNARDAAEAATIAKSDFLARMSHEIRTPMHGMLSMIDILSQKQQDTESQEYLQIMKDSSVSLLSIINDILDISKIESGKMSLDNAPFTLNGLLKEVQQLYLAGAQKKGLELKLINHCTSDNYEGDAHKIRQILNNLVSNALKFTERGYIEISASSSAKQGEKNCILFKVKDTGPGIPEDKQKLLFQRFSQLDGANNRKVGGTGLGLAISKSLSELLGGEIGVTPNPSQGTEFWVQIPVLTPIEAKAFAQADTVGASCPLRKLKILVVDDHPINRKIIEVIFKKNNFNFLLASSGKEAIDIVLKEKIDLVFMDIQMPEMDGLETTRRIRKLYSSLQVNLPIIAMTANAINGDKERFMAVGMQDYISKPFTETEVLELINKWRKIYENNKAA